MMTVVAWREMMMMMRMIGLLEEEVHLLLACLAIITR
jgi:hypothetical protein